MARDPAPKLSPCGTLLHQGDRARFLTALFAPAAVREDLFALYAFNLEVAKTKETVSEPLLGQIRLQWWRETLSEIYAGQSPRKHEVVTPLAAAIHRHGLPQTAFDAIIDGRERDLDVPPPATEAAFAAYVEATGGQLGHLAGRICGADPTQAATAARAYATVGLLIGLPRRAQLGRIDLPLDRLGAAGLTARTIRDGVPSAALSQLVLTFATAAETDLDRLGPVAKAGRAALLPATLARRLIRVLRTAGGDPFQAAAQLRARPDGLLPLFLWWAMQRRRL